MRSTQPTPKMIRQDLWHFGHHGRDASWAAGSTKEKAKRNYELWIAAGKPFGWRKLE